MICANCSFINNFAKVEFFCKNCGFLNSLTNVNYFEYLDIPLSIKINKSVLESHYLQLMMLYHPDKFVNKSLQEKSNSLIHSSFLNDAYNTLLNDLDTIAYIYKIMFNSNIIDEEKTLNNSTIMMEFLDLYEKLDSINSKSDLEIFTQSLLQKKEDVLTSLQTINLLNVNEHIKNQMISLYIKLKYIEKVLQKIKLKVL